MEPNTPKQIKCIYNLSDYCVKKADKSQFRGLCCKVCMVNKQAIYYETHKDNSFNRYNKKHKL